MLKTTLASSLALLALAASSAHAADRSQGTYVIPYAPGTTVHVTNDHTDHSPPGRIDMSGRGGSGGYDIVAAAGGTIRFIQDSFSAARPGQSPCNNNYVWIEHPNGEWTKYSHMSKHSTTVGAGRAVGDTVRTGDVLGTEDDVGCASGDHLHFEVGRPADPSDPIDAQGFLRGGSAENLVPRVCGVPGQQLVSDTDYVVGSLKPGAAEYALHGVSESRYQRVWEEARDCGYRLTWVDGYTDGGSPEFNLVFRQNSPSRAWASFRRLSAAEYQAKFDAYRAQGYRLTYVDAYAVGGAIRYAAIWTKEPGPTYVAYHGVPAAEHQTRLEQLTGDGYVPRVISPVVTGGVRRVAAIYVRQAVGGWEARSNLTPAEYQAKFDANTAAGRRLVYVNAYDAGGSPRITAIWWRSPAATIRARHGLTADGYQAHFDANLAAGFRTQAVAGYEQGGDVRYVAFWAR